MFRKLLNWFDRDIDRVITPVFDWREVVDHRVYRIHWRDGQHLYTTLERAEVAREWLILHGKEPSAIQPLTGYQHGRRR